MYENHHHELFFFLSIFLSYLVGRRRFQQWNFFFLIIVHQQLFFFYVIDYKSRTNFPLHNSLTINRIFFFFLSSDSDALFATEKKIY